MCTNEPTFRGAASSGSKVVCVAVSRARSMWPGTITRTGAPYAISCCDWRRWWLMRCPGSRSVAIRMGWSRASEDAAGPGSAANLPGNVTDWAKQALALTGRPGDLAGGRGPGRSGSECGAGRRRRRRATTGRPRRARAATVPTPRRRRIRRAPARRACRTSGSPPRTRSAPCRRHRSTAGSAPPRRAGAVVLVAQEDPQSHQRRARRAPRAAPPADRHRADEPRRVDDVGWGRA